MTGGRGGGELSPRHYISQDSRPQLLHVVIEHRDWRTESNFRFGSDSRQQQLLFSDGVDTKNWLSEHLPDPPDDITETSRFDVPTVVAWNGFASLADRGRQCVSQANAGGRDGRSGFWRRKTATKTSELIPVAPDFLFCSLLSFLSNFGQANQSSSDYT